MAAEHLPQGVEILLEALVGNEWPEGNDGDLRSMATAWNDLAVHIRGIEAQAQTGVALVGQGIDGPVLQSFNTTVGPIVSEGGYLSGLVPICTGLADALDAMAQEIQILRDIIIELVSLLAAQLALDLALAVFTGGASMAEAAVETAETRVAIATVIRRCIVRVISHFAGSEFTQLGTTIFTELVVQHHLDGSQIRTAAENGAIGGAIGLGMGNLGGLVKAGAGELADLDALTRLSAKIPDNVQTRASQAAELAFDVGWGAASGTAEAAGQDVAAGSFGDEKAGALNGGLGGVLDRSHSFFNPADKLSLSPAQHIDSGLNGLLDGKEPPSPTATPEPDAPPVLEPIPQENWDAWAEGVISSLGNPGD
jgi:hypothetical protein